MSKVFYLLAASALILGACSDDDDNAGNGGDNGSDELRRISVDASDIKGLPSSANIGSIVFYVKYDDQSREDELAFSTWRDGFSMTLPVAVNSSYLSSIYTLLNAGQYEFDDFSDLSVTNTNARVTTGTSLKAQGSNSSSGNYVGTLYVSGDGDEWIIEYIYSDSNLNVKGSIREGDYEGIYEMELKKGWNRVAKREKRQDVNGGYQYSYTLKTDLPSSLHWQFE